MIARMWRCTATPEGSTRYLAYFQNTLEPQLKKLDGFQNAMLLRSIGSSTTEVVVITRWESLEAIRRFAGDTIDLAVIEEEARAMLIDTDAHVKHYEVVAD
jgi:heme-degrading monooxygenase HmoA